MLVAKRCWVAGRVQGVFYRASAQQEAGKLGVRGYAKNLSDGRVEILAIGEAPAVAALVQWLWRGSSASAVTQVESIDVDAAELSDAPNDFATR